MNSVALRLPPAVGCGVQPLAVAVVAMVVVGDV